MASCKYAVVTKSSHTGFIGDSLSSSFLATELNKTCGDALIILGQAAGGPINSALHFFGDELAGLAGVE